MAALVRELGIAWGGAVMMNRVSALIAVVVCISSAAFAQFELASIVGTVKDPTGLPMAQVAVEIRSVATNVVRSTISSATGTFDFVALQPGRYALTATQPGFKVTTQTFELVVGQRLQLDVSLQMGTANESITVGANVVAVESV